MRLPIEGSPLPRLVLNAEVRQISLRDFWSEATAQQGGATLERTTEASA